MIHKILIATMLLFSLASCQKEEAVAPAPEPQPENGIAVQVSLGVKAATGTDYEPMRAGTQNDNLPRVAIGNKFTVVLAKKIGSKWILHKMYEEKIDQGDQFDSKVHYIYDNNTFHSFSTVLTPGDYRMVVFTGTRALNWYQLKPGQVIEDTDNPQFTVPQACYYRKIEQSYLNPGEFGLQEEIFSSYKDFTVEKTDDLHSASMVNEVALQLDRKVSKFRILLHCEPYVVNPTTTHNFFDGYECGVTAKLETNSATPFCNGLNAWGEPFYDQTSTITTMYYGVHVKSAKQIGLDSKEYLVGMRGTRQLSGFYFSDPAFDIPVELSEVEVTASTSIRINYVYAFPDRQFIHMQPDDAVSCVLKHNTITGIVLKPAGEHWQYNNEGYRNMILEVDGSNNPIDASTIFSNYYENKL